MEHLPFRGIECGFCWFKKNYISLVATACHCQWPGRWDFRDLKRLMALVRKPGKWGYSAHNWIMHMIRTYTHFLVSPWLQNVGTSADLKNTHRDLKQPHHSNETSCLCSQTGVQISQLNQSSMPCGHHVCPVHASCAPSLAALAAPLENWAVAAGWWCLMPSAAEACRSGPRFWRRWPKTETRTSRKIHCWRYMRRTFFAGMFNMYVICIYVCLYIYVYEHLRNFCH